MRRRNAMRIFGLAMASFLLFFGSGAAMGESAPLPYSWTQDQDGIRITSYSGTGVQEVTLPDSIDGSPVVAVGSGTFWGNTELQSVTLPLSVVRLDSNAFTGCTNLRSVDGGGLESLGDYAFFGCDSLGELTVSGGLKSVGSELFGSSIPQLSVPHSAGIEGWSDSYFTLELHFPDIPMGRVGETRVTPKLLALYSLLNSYTALPVSDTEALWDQSPLTGTIDNVEITCRGFADYYSAAAVTGLYDLLRPEDRGLLDTRLDAMLDELERDAALLY